MPRRRPVRRLVAERSSENVKRRLVEPPPGHNYRTALQTRLRFEGHSKHKLEPRAFGMEPYTGRSEDPTYCDGHAGFKPRQMRSARRMLCEGVAAGLIGDNEKQGDPTLLWTVGADGWIFEARLTTPGQALYHAFPVLPSEAIARKVLARFTDWAYDQADATWRTRARRAQERYA